MVNWYFKSFDQEFGPVTHDELKALAEGGQIGLNDRIRKGETGKWYKAKRVAGLLPGSESLGHTDDEVTDDSESDSSESDTVAVQTDVRRWLCEVNGHTEGPYDFEHLRAAIAAGSVGPDDRIRNSRETAWHSVTELAAELAADGMFLWPDRAPVESVTDTAEIAASTTLTELPRSTTADQPATTSASSPAAAVNTSAGGTSSSLPPPAGASSANMPVVVALPAPPRPVPPPPPKSDRPSIKITLPKFELAWSPAQWATVAGILLCAGVVALGFGSSSSVSGQVQIDGQTLPVGQVTFRPSGSNRGRTFSISIAGGRFAATDDSLQVSGSYDVIVVAGNALGLPVEELAAIPSLAGLNGARFEANIDGDGSGRIDLQFNSSDAIMPVVEKDAGSPVMLE